MHYVDADEKQLAGVISKTNDLVGPVTRLYVDTSPSLQSLSVTLYWLGGRLGYVQHALSSRLTAALVRNSGYFVSSRCLVWVHVELLEARSAP